MEGLSLPAVCSTAFAAVVVVLAALALIVHLVTLVFPAPSPRSEPAVLAAIAAAVASSWPGARVVHIEEAP